jgi:ribosomal protein S18 acetylase RimI-like enzyme
VQLRAVVDEPDLDLLMRLHDEVFGGDHSGLGRLLAADLAAEPSRAATVVAVAGSTPICGGRVRFHAGTAFASLWSGGALPAWRRRGVFRSLVAHRAALAAARAFR